MEQGDRKRNDGFGQPVIGNPWGLSAHGYAVHIGEGVKERIVSDFAPNALERIKGGARLAFSYAALVLQEEELFATAVPR